MKKALFVLIVLFGCSDDPSESDFIPIEMILGQWEAVTNSVTLDIRDNGEIITTNGEILFYTLSQDTLYLSADFYKGEPWVFVDEVTETTMHWHSFPNDERYDREWVRP